MSYEGSKEYICEIGHYTIIDQLYSIECCPTCGGALRWFHKIDETNGEMDGFPDTMPAPKIQVGEDRIVIPTYAPDPNAGIWDKTTR